MYKVKNVALIDKMASWGTGLDSLDDLYSKSEDEIVDFAFYVGSEPMYETKMQDKDENGQRRTERVLSVRDTIARIKKDNTVRMMMLKSYWETRHKEVAKMRGIDDSMRAASHGSQTIALGKELRVAFEVGPGEEATVDFTKRYVADVVQNHPALREGKIKIIDESQEEVKAVELPKEQDIKLEDLDYKAICGVARKYNLPYVGRTKIQVLKLITDYQDKVSKAK